LQPVSGGLAVVLGECQELALRHCSAAQGTECKSIEKSKDVSQKGYFRTALKRFSSPVGFVLFKDIAPPLHLHI
jgi:hypothetical protein